MELSGEFPVKLLCETMGIQRSSFYSWKKRLSDPSERTRAFVSNILLFQEYHLKYPSHGYRWLNAKIRLDTGLDEYIVFFNELRPAYALNYLTPKQYRESFPRR